MMNPVASIVILTYNNLVYTRLCLDSVLAQPAGVPYELVVVDNGSTDGTIDYLVSLSEQLSRSPVPGLTAFRVLPQSENQGFARGNNLGAAAAAGEIIVFLNNDTLVTPGWLGKLAAHLADPGAGMVGPVTNSIGNEARIPVGYILPPPGQEGQPPAGMEAMCAFAEAYTAAHAGQVFEIPMLALFCVAVPRRVWDVVGPLDEQFGQGMFEDDDYSRRLHQMGYKTICAEDVFVHHWGSASFSRLPSSEYWDLFARNKKRYETKWNTTWEPPVYRTELLPDRVRELIDNNFWLGVQLSERDAVIRQQQAYNADLKRQLNDVLTSKGWLFLERLRRLRTRLFPPDSAREKLMKSTLAFLRRFVRWYKKTFTLRVSWYGYAFRAYKQARSALYAPSLRGLAAPHTPGLVSIVLPVYNGERYIAESIESVLQQTYPHFELIVVDDGSKDRTPQIVQEYAQKDGRVWVLRQKNERLPAALTHGFRQARGEYLTWTSDDNRMKPDFLEKLVSTLAAHPDWDMVYANQDIIGEDGEPLRGSGWFYDYQAPTGSEHIHLPMDPSELNTWPNNYVGAAFMYRARVKHLVGDYLRLYFGAEDYDYWMRINALLTLRHVGFREPVYEYRFHGASLTSRDEELGITRMRDAMMVFEDFRRDFYLTPLAWTIEGQLGLVDEMKGWAEKAGHLLLENDPEKAASYPRLWFPRVFVYAGEAPPPAPFAPVQGGLRVLVLSFAAAPPAVGGGWDVCLRWQPGRSPAGPVPDGWLAAGDVETLMTALDIRARQVHLEAILSFLAGLAQGAANQFAPLPVAASSEAAPLADPPSCKISVIICTYQRGPALLKTLESAATQDFPAEDYEVLLVNNDPTDMLVGEIFAKVHAAHFAHRPDRFRLVVCPLKGLSFARNAGLSEAQGELCSYLDDDAIPDPDWLSTTWAAYQQFPQAGIIGGKIIVTSPEPCPEALKPGWEKFWSHFDPGFTENKAVQHWWEFPWGANWTARRTALAASGGFRASFGRVGKNFAGGEEIVAAILIQRLGYQVVVAPASRVLHNPDPRRYTYTHVKKTILASKWTELRQQKMLYLPMQLGPRYFLKAFVRHGLDVLNPSPRHPSHLRLEGLYYLQAQLPPLWEYVKDSFLRLRRTLP